MERRKKEGRESGVERERGTGGGRWEGWLGGNWISIEHRHGRGTRGVNRAKVARARGRMRTRGGRRWRRRRRRRRERRGRAVGGVEERVEGGCRTLQGILRPRHYGEQMSNSLNPRVLWCPARRTWRWASSGSISRAIQNSLRPPTSFLCTAIGLTPEVIVV